MAENRKFQSFSVWLSLKFMVILAVAVLALSIALVVIIQKFIRSEQSKELEMTAAGLTKLLDDGKNIEAEVLGFPYYISYSVYEPGSENVISTNDPYIPLLKLTNGRSEMYYSRNFFADGDLNILYSSKEVETNGRKLIIQVSINIEFDANFKLFKILPKAIALSIIPIFVISFFVALLIAKNTISPVVKITKSARTIGSSNLDTLLPTGSHKDEISELAETFNSLFKRLKQDFDQERQFTSDVSHELKTPVAVIGGQANMLLRWGKDDPVQLEKSLVTIKNEAKSMQAIIENLLQISRIENGRIQPQLVRVSLDEMFNRLKIEIEAFAPGVKIECSGKGLNIDTDEELFHQVMTVMMQNSVKFTGEGCVIKLNAFTEGERVKVTVEDNGPGIDEKALPHIFERFYRGDEAHTRTAGGSGLGLSIAKTIVEALGGKIGAQNRPEGGALLWIKF